METRNKRTKVVVSVLALGGLLVFSLFTVGGNLEPSGPPGPTMKTLDEVEPRIPISSVPLAITQSGAYYLTGDVQVDPWTPANGITINADNVTIDLMGYSLIGPGSGSNDGIYMNERNNVEVRNGTIQNFGRHGVHEDSELGKGHRVIGVRAVSNGEAGVRLRGFGHLAKGCTASGNGSVGLHAHQGSTLTGNTVHQNQSAGITASYGCTVIGNTAYNNENTGISTNSGCTVTGNTAYENGSIGIFASNGCTITNNTVYNNQSAGIYAWYGCAVIKNTVRLNNQRETANYGGIWVYSNCLVKANTGEANRKNNIYVSSTDNAIEENLVTECPSGGSGIYFRFGDNFYANNRAASNSTNYGGTLPTGGGDGGGNAEF